MKIEYPWDIGDEIIVDGNRGTIKEFLHGEKDIVFVDVCAKWNVLPLEVYATKDNSEITEDDYWYTAKVPMSVEDVTKCYEKGLKMKYICTRPSLRKKLEGKGIKHIATSKNKFKEGFTVWIYELSDALADTVEEYYKAKNLELPKQITNYRGKE